MKSDKEFIDETKEQVKEMHGEMIKSLNDEFTYAIYKQCPILPVGYQVDRNPSSGDRVYSSILKKYINTKTGLPVEE